MWTDFKPTKLSLELAQAGYLVAPKTAANLLEQAGYRNRTLRKELITGKVDPCERDQQFRYISTLRQEAHENGNPVFYADTKKKEKIGSLSRDGRCYSTGEQPVFDHDYVHLADGVLVPHGIYDYFDNIGYMTLGTSRETTAFVCDAIALAWEEHFKHNYPKAKEIVLTFDCGGANAARSLRFKEDLVQLSQHLGLPLRIAHYPPYTSKWHPIEHRLFSQIERSFSGVILDSHHTALDTIERTTTKTGLRLFGSILDKVYEIDRKCSDGFRGIKDRYI